MNKHLYIVEGKTDVSKLKHIGIEYVIKTDGFGVVTRETISFIKQAYKIRPIVILTDPDGPGRRIAATISKALEPETSNYSFEVISVNKQQAIAHNKVGIAEMNEDLLEIYLKTHLEADKASEEEQIYTLQDLAKLGLTGPNSQIRRDKLLQHFPVNKATSKTLLDSLNILRIDPQELGALLNE